MVRALVRLNLALLAAFWAAALALWPHAPETIPIHFDVAGTPDTWAERTVWTWFMLPLIATGLSAFLYFCGRLGMRYPSVLNLPNKDEILRLDAGSRRAVLEETAAGLNASSVVITGAFALIHLGMWYASIGGDGTALILGALMLTLLAGPIALILILLPTQHALDEARRRRPATT